MNQWQIMSPYARVVLQGENHPTLVEALKKFPGVRLRGNVWNVPLNAITVVQQTLAHFGVGIKSATWAQRPSKTFSWAEIESALRAGGEVRDFVLDGFLTEYQKTAVAFGWGKSGVLFWLSTGAGKTIIGILTALAQPGPVLVVTRAAARTQIAREIERFLQAKVYVVRPSGQPVKVLVNGESWNQFRSRHKGRGLTPGDVAAMWQAHKAEHGVQAPRSLHNYMEECKSARQRPFVVIGWEALADRLQELKEHKFSSLILDEHHMAKSPKRWIITHLPDLPDDPEAARQLCQAQEATAKAEKGFIRELPEGRKMFTPVVNRASAAAEMGRLVRTRIALTATPIADRPRDLWAQLDGVEPNAWGSSSEWRKRHCSMRPGIYGGMDDRGASNLEELKVRLNGLAFILSYAETHRHLPPKRRQSVYVSPEDQVQPVGGDKAFMKELAGAKQRGASAVLEVRLAMAASKKRKAVLGIIEDHVRSGQKVVVFTGRRRDCDALGELVRKTSGVKETKARVWAAHGDASTDLRQKIVDDYMADPGPAVLVGTGDAFGTSINLDATDAALLVQLPWTPERLRQWEGRFHRASTKRPVIIYYIIAEDTVDEHVAEVLINKLPNVEKVAEDKELAEAKAVLSGIDPSETSEDFAKSILSSLDFDSALTEAERKRRVEEDEQEQEDDDE